MRVYVAGSYSADNVIGVLNNIQAGIKASVAVLKAGHAPFCSWLDHQFQFFDNTITVEDYYRYSLAWLEVSDVMLVLPSSENSKGTQVEIKRAKDLGIPIVYSMIGLSAVAHKYETEHLKNKAKGEQHG